MNNRELKSLVEAIMCLEINMARSKATARSHPDKDRRAGAKFFYNVDVKRHAELESQLPLLSNVRVGYYRWKTPREYPFLAMP